MAAPIDRSAASLPVLLVAVFAALALLVTQAALRATDMTTAADAVYLALIVAASVACLARAVLRSDRRLAWALIGAGICFWAAGEAEYLRAEAAGHEPAVWAEAAYLGLYVFAVAGVVALFSRSGRRGLGLTLDLGVGVLGVVTLWFWLVFSHFTSIHAHGSVVDVVYPILDLSVTIVALVLISQNRWRPAPATLAIGAGFLVAAIADSIFAVQSVHGEAATTPLVSFLWPSAALLLGFAAWLPANEQAGRPRPLPFLISTTGATAIAVAALIWGNFNDVHAHSVLVGLALLTLVAAVARGIQLYADRLRALASVRSEGMRSVRALAAAADARDRYTRDHSRRVAVYSTAIAVRLGLAIEEIEQLATAAELHDVGKIATPDAILLKPAKLTQEEYELIKRHSEEGERILRAMGRARIATWVRHHHERWDGRGYPDGLTGEEIPRQSRILAAADALDAMTTDRSYSLAVSTEGAIDEIERSAGTQLDPEIASCLVGLLRDRIVRPPEGDAPLRYELVPETGGRLRAADYGRVLEILAALAAGDGPRSHEIALTLPRRGPASWAGVR